MEVINIAFHTISCLLALLAAALLLWVNQERKHSNRMLAFILILFAMQNLVFLLLFSRLMLKAPWLLRVFGPTTFLIAPLLFVYIRSVLNDELKFRKYDWLLLIPAILALINFIPFYLLPAQEKIDYLNKSFYNKIQSQDTGRGFLPTPIYYIFRICWSGVFLFISFRMIYLFKKKNTAELVAKNSILLNWLFTFNSLLTAVFIVTSLRSFIPVLKNTNLTIADILLGATILFICLQLFVRPQILYGVFKPLPKVNNGNEITAPLDVLLDQTASVTVDEDDLAEKNKEVATAINMGPADQLRYKILIENYFQEKKPFLQTEYSLEQLVADTHIPRYILSAFINREYGMGFREYLNRHRVNFFKDNLNNPLWSNLTLEAIAEECGFNSRITFIHNFKKIAGQTPSEYLKTNIGR